MSHIGKMRKNGLAYIELHICGDVRMYNIDALSRACPRVRAQPVYMNVGPHTSKVQTHCWVHKGLTIEFLLFMVFNLVIPKIGV